MRLISPWIQKAVTALVVLGLVLGAGAWWADSRQADIAYLFRPLTVELEGVVASEDRAVVIRLEQMTLTGTELKLTGLLERKGFEGWRTRHLQVSLVNMTRPGRLERLDMPLGFRYGSSPSTWEMRYGADGKLRAEWRFPYRQLDAEPGDELAFLLSGFALEKRIDGGDTVRTADLTPDRLPADLRVGQDGIYRIRAVDWTAETGGTRISAEYLPGSALEGLGRGYQVDFSVPMISDQRGERYRSVGGSGSGSPGEPRLMENTFLPVDPQVATELTFSFYSVSLDWHHDAEAVPHAMITIPRGRH